MFAMAERSFGTWARGPDPFKTDPIPEIPAITANDAVVAEAPVNAVTVIVQWQGPSIGKDPKSTYAADVFSDLLNDPRSRFQQRLVDSGLWQGIVRELLQSESHWPDLTQRTDDPRARQRGGRRARGRGEEARRSRVFHPAELKAVQAHRSVTSAYDRERASGFAHTLGFWWSVASLEYYMGYVDNMAKSDHSGPSRVRRQVHSRQAAHHRRVDLAGRTAQDRAHGRAAEGER